MGGGAWDSCRWAGGCQTRGPGWRCGRVIPVGRRVGPSAEPGRGPRRGRPRAWYAQRRQARRGCPTARRVGMRHWLEAVDQRTPGQVAGQEQLERQTRHALEAAVRRCSQRQHHRDVVQLRRVAPNAVAEVHAPGQRGGHAVGVVVQPGREAADAADHQAAGDGHTIASPVERVCRVSASDLDAEQAASRPPTIDCPGIGTLPGQRGLPDLGPLDPGTPPCCPRPAGQPTTMIEKPPGCVDPWPADAR